MDQPSAVQPETPQTLYEAWRRFTLLDLLILFTGHEAALGILKWYGLLAGSEHFYPSDSINTALNVAFIVYLFFILGGVLSIPVILLVQFCFRHRKEETKGGEYYAVGYCILWAIVIIGLRTFGPIDMQIPVAVTTVVGSPVFLCGGILFVKCIFTSDKKAGCKWLGLYGYFLCFVSVISVIYALVIFWIITFLH
jgi:hypothetical protein